MIDRLDIHAFADRELAPEEMARAEHEIASSPEARKELEAIQSLKSCLQVKLHAPEARDLWKSCVGRLDELDKVKRAETFVSKYAWAICAFLFVVILTGGMLRRSQGPTATMAQLAAGMGDFVSTTTPQPQQLGQWIKNQTGERTRFWIDPREVVAVAYADRPEGREVRITLRDGSGFVDFLVIPNVTRVEGVREIGDGMYAGQIGSYNCVTWPDSGAALIVVGDRTTNELHDFAISHIR